MQPYVSPFILAQQKKASARTKARGPLRKKKAVTESQQWNDDFTKGDGYFDPSIKKPVFLKSRGKDGNTSPEPIRRPNPKQGLNSPDSIVSTDMFDEFIPTKSSNNNNESIIIESIPKLHGDHIVVSMANPSQNDAVYVSKDMSVGPGESQIQQTNDVNTSQTSQELNSHVFHQMHNHHHPHTSSSSSSSSEHTRHRKNHHHKTRSTSPIDFRAMSSILGETYIDPDEPKTRAEVKAPSEYNDILSSVATMMDAVSGIVKQGFNSTRNIPAYPGLGSRRASYSPRSSSPRAASPRGSISPRANSPRPSSPRNIAAPSVQRLFESVAPITQGAALPLAIPTPSPAAAAAPVNNITEFNLNTDNRRRLSSILGEEPGAPVPSAAELADRIEARLHAIDRAEIGARELLQKPVHRYSTAKDGTCGVHIPSEKSAEERGSLNPTGALPVRGRVQGLLGSKPELISESHPNSAGLVEFQVDETGEVVVQASSDHRARKEAERFLDLRPTSINGVPPLDSGAAFVASLQPGGISATTKTTDNNGKLQPLPYQIQLIPNDGLRTACKEYNKQLKALKKVREAALNQRGLTLAQTCQTLGDGFVEELLDSMSEEMEDFFESYAQKIVDKL